jgi:hypothetical protein
MLLLIDIYNLGNMRIRAIELLELFIHIVNIHAEISYSYHYGDRIHFIYY